MKKHIITAVALFTTLASFSQIKVHSGGSVGLGFTTTPLTGFKFHVVGNSTFTASSSTPTSAAYIRGLNAYSTATTPDYTWWGNDQVGMFHPGSNIIGFSISGSEKIRLHSNGFLGIANTSPAYAVDIGTGDMNVNTLTNGYRLGGNMILWQKNLTTGLFVGNGAGAATTGTNNHAFGYKALNANTTGTSNLAVGSFALFSNTTGIWNTAIGDSALYSITTGNSCVAVGTHVLKSNTSGNNTAAGARAMYKNTTGTANTAVGFGALNSNTTGAHSSALGYYALVNSTGGSNTAIGYQTLQATTSGYENTAVGKNSGYSNTTGYQNTMAGYQAGYTNTTGYSNTFIGAGADANSGGYNNATAIGNGAIVGASNAIKIGNASVSIIGGYTTWFNYSDSRFKTNVQENVKGLEFIMKLRPVTYKIDVQSLDSHIIQNMPDSAKAAHIAMMDYTANSTIVHSGFLAQEVEQAAQQTGFSNSIVATPANSNDVYSLSYSEFVVPLVKAVQEQNARMDSLSELVEKLDSTNTALKEELLYITLNCCAATNRFNNATISEPSKGGTASSLGQNKPNPFNSETVIEYNVVEEGTASILVFDMNGKLLKTLVIKIPGRGSVTINAKDLYPGMYLYSLIVNEKEIDTKKMILTE